MTYSDRIATTLKIKPTQVTAAVQLLEEGNTIPFIARYRKEMTGTLDEEQLRQVQAELERLKALDERRAAVLASITEQGKLSPELEAQIQAAETMTVLEDLYLPYKPKRRTRASIARDKGLQGLADWILTQARTQHDAEHMAQGFLNEQVASVEEALAGARDIAAETIAENADVRQRTREGALQQALLTVEKIEDAPDEKKVYELYYQFESLAGRLRPHQVLAIDRGEAEKVLRVRFTLPEPAWRGAVTASYKVDERSPFADQLRIAIDDAAERLLIPAIERDVRRRLSETAGAHAIRVFADNLRGLLLVPPIAGQVVLGLDPGFRTGCKVAVVDETGKLLDTTTIYPHEPQKHLEESAATLRRLIDQFHVTLISIGNGTASRETEALAARLCREVKGLQYIITNEAGASVYSASPLARAEFPQLDVSLRGAVSIARRVQDPLAELVKIEPRSIGVGLYQHDVDQTALTDALHGVVEDVVNQVGVDVNTASPALLTNVAGIGPKLAEKMVAYRDEHGAFRTREELKAVPTLGPKAFEQSAGFLRIPGGDNPLDASAIHPESYAAAAATLQRAGVAAGARPEEIRRKLALLRRDVKLADLAAGLGVGELTLTDILDQLALPGRDPRADAPAPILRSDVLKMEDLTPGMHLKGTVRNVVDFGAFVDIGVKQDGLLHRTQIPREETLAVGQVIEVQILKVEAERGRISLGWG
ncbi:transcriptional accessory protein [Longilinea arvoryzae]|uniref:Transcriptional accessory protein n=1 Tax=Longilinea arvoryzae TaxID=360412 RepID=A0A0K8MXY0_9CHLR|nr:Tex family protein [Longilinea arvoryzae]GAP16065.1 transcriptional accessory protein [Longilinea arvoryzae]